MAANRSRRSVAMSNVAPTGGLNDKDSIANMLETDAVILENWFPGTRSVNVRGGCLEHSIGLPETGETLLSYNGRTVKKLFVAAGTVIYNVDAITPVSVVTGLTNARLDCINFGNNGGEYLVCVNGADLPQFYNGSTWAKSDGVSYATAITDALGLLTAPIGHQFTQVNAWKNRLYFVEKNSMRCWYLGVQAIGGAAAPLDFSGVAKLGGTLIATTTVTTSAGLTLDDYFCAITSEGECLVYRGTDPSDASKFALVGNYRIGRPIANGSDHQGGRWLAKYSSDIVGITADGFTTLQAALNADVVAQQRTINDKIINTVTDAVSSHAAKFGWQIILCPMQNKLIINVPTTELSESYQFVMNTITGAWCKFTGWNATCFAYHDDSIYAIIGTKVYEMDVSELNDFVPADGSTHGSLIEAYTKTAYIYFGGRESVKMFQMARPLLYTSGEIAPTFNINVNLIDEPITGTITLSSSNPTYWDVAEWATDNGVGDGPLVGIWPPENVPYQDWSTVNGLGYSAALKMIVQANNQKVQWDGWEIMFSPAGLL
jgi:hypothetical protein